MFIIIEEQTNVHGHVINDPPPRLETKTKFHNIHTNLQASNRTWDQNQKQVVKSTSITKPISPQRRQKMHNTMIIVENYV